MKSITFEDYIAICNTKARYCRFLDEKNWDGYGDVFTEDAELDTSGSGGSVMKGRDQLVEFVRSSLENTATAHQVHSPEITLVDDNVADVIWAMQDRVVWDDSRAQATGIKSLTGYGHYRERYRQCEDGLWRIASSALTRLHIDFEKYTP